MGSATQSSSPRSATRRAGALWEWLWRSRALDSAYAKSPSSRLSRERLQRAKYAAELADRECRCADPRHRQPALSVAVSLYRQAAYWALLGRSDDAEAADVREVFNGSQYDLARTGLTQHDLALVRAVLTEKTFVHGGEDSVAGLQREADLCRAFVRAVLEDAPDWDEDRAAVVLTERWVRVSAVLLVGFGLWLAIGLGLERAVRGPDLVLGKPWRASSYAFPCHPERHICATAHSAIFFHTQLEDVPSVEIDLGATRSFRRLTVVNREDCCAERAVPLLFEVSNDRLHWREVARRDRLFRDWETRFAAVQARYVRLRVARRSILHLVRVSLHAS
jgi:hypothetical protein